MSTSVPDGISFADLQALAKDAPNGEPAVPADGPYNGLTEDELKELVDDQLNKIHEACPHPMFAKAIIYRIIANMMEWHSAAGLSQINDGEKENAVYWLRDAGKFQAMLNIVCSIGVGPDDFITPDE